MSNSLKLRDIHKSFASSKVLKSISVEFNQGTVTSIVGDNGAGKSTLCKIISGFLPSDSGTVMLGETSLTNLGPMNIRNLGVEMIYQDLALVKQQGVITNLFLGRELVRSPFAFLNRRQMAKKAAILLGELGVTIRDLSVPVNALSGGQQQCIAIARALLFSPKVVILDEPTASLAVREIEQVLGIIRNLKSRGIIVILVSHRLNDVFAVSDRIITLHSGEIAADELVSETSIQKIVQHMVGATVSKMG